MTQHNNESMQTVVETFFIEETVNLIYDGEALDKWKQKITELGLVGQTNVAVADKSPIPFLWMNESLINTFMTLCPTRVNIKEYDKTPIPVELLETVSLCVNEGYFDAIEVWYNEKEKDPAIIGFKQKEGRSLDRWDLMYYAEKYLIGRWADVKASLDTLIERAKVIFTNNERMRLLKDIKDRQRELEDLEFNVEAKFSGLPRTNFPF